MIPLPSSGTIVVLAFAAGALVTYKVMDWKADAERLEQERITHALNAQGVVIANRTEGQVREVVRTVYVRGATIVKEVPVYVTKQDNAACTINTGFVRVHDAAVANQPPGPPADTDRAATGVALSTVGETVAENYTHYHACVAKVKAWEQFYADLRANWGKPR